MADTAAGRRGCQRQNAEITIQLGLWAKRDGTGRTFDSSGGFVLPNGATRSPDASWVRHGRLAALTAEDRAKFLPLCPDFVIELRSLTDGLSVLQDKMREYMENGAELGWLIDPLAGQVFVYRPGAPVERLEEPDNVSADPVLPGFRLELAGSCSRYLADDDATGILQESGGAEVIRFPGREEPAPVTFRAFNQTGVLDGVLIRIGGRDDTVPAHLRDGDTTHLCNATREMARRLAVHLHGPPLRVHGNGRWERDADGGWVMKRFNITSFDVLDDAPLGEVVRRLRDVEGSGWKEIEDPAAELRHLRGLEEAH